MSEPIPSDSAALRLEGLHCTLTIERPVPGVVVVTIAGNDVGEFARAPLEELAKDLAQNRKIELFVDTRETQGVTLDASTEWAVWLAQHRHQLHHLTMLVGSRFVELTARFVRRFAGLEGIMRLTTDPSAFEDALSDALRARN